MKDKKVLILIVLAAVASAVFLFLSKPTVNRKNPAHPEQIRQGETDSAKLRKELGQVRDLIQSSMQINSSLRDNLNAKEQLLREEKEKFRDLQVELANFILANEMLNKELISTRADLAELKKLTQPLIIKLEEKESADAKELKEAIDAKSILEKKVDQLQKKGTILEKQNQKLTNQLAAGKKKLTSLAEIRRNFKQEKNALSAKLKQSRKELSHSRKKAGQLTQKYKTLKTGYEQLSEQLNDSKKRYSTLEKEKQVLLNQQKQNEDKVDRLNRELTQKNQAYRQLQKEFDSAKSNIAQNEMELAKRAERILRFQDRLAVSETKTEQLKKDALQQKKESATLRKQYVVGQLENETLKSQLNQHKQRLLNLQTRITQVNEANSVLQDRLQDISGISEAKIAPPYSESR